MLHRNADNSRRIQTIQLYFDFDSPMRILPFVYKKIKSANKPFANKNKRDAA